MFLRNTQLEFNKTLTFTPLAICVSEFKFVF